MTTLHTASWGINPEHRNLAAIRGVVTGWDETMENVSADEQNEVGSNIGKTVALLLADRVPQRRGQRADFPFKI